MEAVPRLGRPRYSLVVPVYDEQEVLPELYERLGRVLSALDDPFEVVFVDDGSTDGSPGFLRALQAADKRLRIVTLSRNFGHQAAITAGLTYTQGDVVAVLDADLQDPPELLPALFHALDEGADVAYGVRRERKEGLAKRTAYFLFYRLLRGIAEVDIPADSGDFCAMTRRVVDHLNRLPESDRFVRGLRAWLGFHQVGIPYERARRHAGVPKYTLLKLVRLSVDGLLSFSTAPLRLIAGAGLGIAVLSLGGILVVLYRYLFTPYVAGYTSLAILVLFMGGIQLFTLGIVGEYVARVSRQVKSRPTFVVAELTGFDSSA